MKPISKQLKFILQIFLIIITFTNLHAKKPNKYYSGNTVSEYFSGLRSIQNNEYAKSYIHFKNLDGLEQIHYDYSKMYLLTLINLNRFKEAVIYSQKLKKGNIDNFESNLIISVDFLKKNKFAKAKEILLISKKKTQDPLQDLILTSILNWINFQKNNLDDSIKILNSSDQRFKNINKIQNLFVHFFFNSKNIDKEFEKLSLEKDIDFTRYNFFYAHYLNANGDKKRSRMIIKKSLSKSPRNLILNQLMLDFEAYNKSNSNEFEFDNVANIIAENFYVFSNILSSQLQFSSSNFYLNLARYLNPKFSSYDTLLAENYLQINNLAKAKTYFKKIFHSGRTYKWYAIKSLSRIMIIENDSKAALEYLHNNFKKLQSQNVHEIFDMAEFFKNNEKYKKSIVFYDKVLNSIDKNHILYSEASEGRGIALERVGNWNKAENDLLNSLSVSPNKAYVINYLAYSWIEQGINIERSLKMLKKANKLKPNDGYITDSLGWAFFKLEKYLEAKKYLQLAVTLMPSDPIVNDHFGDSLYMSGEKLQARYIWNNVLKFDGVKKEMIKNIETKLIFGLDLDS